MKILKYLLNYISLFMIVLIVFALIYFRAEIFPENINKPINSSISLLESQFDIVVPTYQKADNDVNNSAPSMDIEANLEEQDKFINEVEISAEENKNSRNQQTMVNTPADTVPSPPEEISTQPVSHSPITMNEPSTELIQNNEAVKTPVNENPTTEAFDNTKDILNQARKAYWNGQINVAEKYYIQLTKNNNAEPNAYGELGNIYYMQGKWKEAGSAYYEAAVRLIDKNQHAQVNYLLRVIQGLNPEAAKKLQKKY